MTDDDKTPPATPSAITLGDLDSAAKRLSASRLPVAIAHGEQSTPSQSKARTYELWAGKFLAAFLTGAYATGLIPTSGWEAQVASILATVLIYLGFVVYRARGAATMFALAMLVGHTSACTKNARIDTIDATYATLKASDAALLKYDKQHYEDLVSQAPDRATLDREVAQWKSQRLAIETVRGAAYAACAGAALANDGASLQAMLEAASTFASELAAFGIKP